MKWKEQLLSLAPYKPGRPIESVKKEYGLEKVVKLASNENPFGTSPKVVTALKSALTSFAIYPDGYATNLRTAVAEFLNINEEQLIFGNGADNLIQIISRAFLMPGKNTVMASPTFSQYKHNAIIDGAEVREIPLLDGEHDLESMVKAIDENTAVVWVCSPNNPTGVYISKENMTAFLNKVPKETLVVIDDAYHDYVVADDFYNAEDFVNEYRNLIVLRTFSKIYGIASLRVGYGIAHQDIIRVLEPAREPFNVNTLGQIAAVAAIDDQEYVVHCRQKNREGMAQFEQFCEEHKLHYFPSQANFILIDFGTSGDEVFQYLLKKGYIVRSGNALGYASSVRVTVGSAEENNGVIHAMKQYLAENASVTK
ncbi:histidinol-phosphate transaminase [Bacillus tuaregi]|uniref:histidinol-phosphate transaminase n=1 Tax=Bacillus tuaregi TaxID=1816695 RepID=UPI0008F9575F|nr:histidinol-phosphate transaminase [Bacillus tuaregi]